MLNRGQRTRKRSSRSRTKALDADADKRLVFKEVLDPQDPDLAVLANLLHEIFVDPAVRMNLEQLQRMVTRRLAVERTNHVILAKQGGAVLGATVFCYVAPTNIGFSSYMLVTPEARGKGLGRWLFQQRLAALNQDAQAQGNPCVQGLLIEVASPRRQPEELASRESRVTITPEERRAIFGHMGFRCLDLEYVQPPIRAGEEPVTYYDLLYRPVSTGEGVQVSNGRTGMTGERSVKAVGKAVRGTRASSATVRGSLIIASLQSLFPDSARPYLHRLAEQIAGREIRLLPAEESRAAIRLSGIIAS